MHVETAISSGGDTILEYSRRSGDDRRANRKPDGNINRAHEERRSVYSHYKLITVLDKIPIFKGLSDAQFNKILLICSKQAFPKDSAICKVGDESYQIFILIKGDLKVLLPTGKEIARISPIGIVGEMGVFTGARRSASVVAATECIMITIHKSELYRVLRRDSDLSIRILTNVIKDMSDKMRNNNVIIDELRQVCPSAQFSLILSKLADDQA